MYGLWTGIAPLISIVNHANYDLSVFFLRHGDFLRWLAPSTIQNRYASRDRGSFVLRVHTLSQRFNGLLGVGPGQRPNLTLPLWPPAGISRFTFFEGH
jgi:hypothetical protein